MILRLKLTPPSRSHSSSREFRIGVFLLASILLLSWLLDRASSQADAILQESTTGATNSIQNYSQARTSPIRVTTTTLPTTCNSATAEMVVAKVPSTPPILYVCGPTDNNWQALGSATHSLLSGLAFAQSGHTGFASSAHASTHLAGSSDPLTSLVAVPLGVPQAGTLGTIDNTWLPLAQGTDGASPGRSGAVPAPAPANLADCLKGNMTWGSCGSGGSAGILTQRGGLLTHTGLTETELAPGTQDMALVIDSTSPTGLAWKPLVFHDEDPIITATNHNGTCLVSDFISFIAPNVPTCSIGTGSTPPYTWAGLDLPDNALTCFNVEGTVPNAWAGTAPDVRIKWNKVSGGWGLNQGGACVADPNHPESNPPECWKLYVYSSFQADGASSAVPSYNPVTPSDVMPARQVSNEFTGAVRGVNVTGAAKRYGSSWKFCRDSRSTNADDTIAGVVKIRKIYTDWAKSVVGN